MTNIQQLLHDYTDGTLPHQMEEYLFAALAQSEDLRSELRNQRSVQNAAANDMASITPPSGAKADIFLRLGVALPPPVPVQPQPIANASRTNRAWWFGGAAFLLSALTGSVATWMFLSSTATHAPSDMATARTQHDGMKNSIHQQSAKSVQSGMTTPSPVLTGNRVSMVNMHRLKNQAPLSESHPIIASPVIAPYQPDDVSAQSSLNTIVAAPPDMMLNKADIQKNSPLRAALMLRQSIPLVSVAPVNTVFIPEYENAQLSVSLRGMSSAGSTAFTGGFSNAALNVLYSLAQDHAIGCDIANEQFSLMSVERTATGTEEITSTRQLQTFGVAYRYTLSNALGEGFSPLVQPVVGATSGGNAFGRVLLGAEWQPGGAVSLMLGVDAAAIPYRTSNGGALNLSQKFSIVYALRMAL
ncbi:MAG: hypothetical protein JNL32_02405 [Candidatus Kapabacteria bacterium]|nr:hypothetical protein [Candidatus Kapabacteria bacterium]